MKEELRKASFESGQFQGSKWSTLVVATNIPPRPRVNDPGSKMYAELSYYELAHLLPSEMVELSGAVNAVFWKIEEQEIMCQIDGKLGTYEHDGDVGWEERRYRVERMFQSLLEN